MTELHAITKTKRGIDRRLEIPDHDTLEQVALELMRDSVAPLEDVGHYTQVLQFYAERIRRLARRIP